MPQQQSQQTRTMLVVIRPEAGILEFTAQPTNTRGLTLINLCHEAITDYEERQHVVDAVSKSAASQYQQLSQALQQAQEQRGAAKETVAIMMNRLAEHFYLADEIEEPDAETAGQTADGEPDSAPAPDVDTVADGEQAPDIDPAPVPPPEIVDIVAITKKTHSRLLSKPVPWVSIAVSRDIAQNRPTAYGKVMTELLKDAATMINSHDDIIKPKGRKPRRNAPNLVPSPDQSIADGLMDTAEQTLGPLYHRLPGRQLVAPKRLSLAAGLCPTDTGRATTRAQPRQDGQTPCSTPRSKLPRVIPHSPTPRPAQPGHRSNPKPGPALRLRPDWPPGHQSRVTRTQRRPTMPTDTIDFAPVHNLLRYRPGITGLAITVAYEDNILTIGNAAGESVQCRYQDNNPAAMVHKMLAHYSTEATINGEEVQRFPFPDEAQMTCERPGRRVLAQRGYAGSRHLGPVDIK